MKLAAALALIAPPCWRRPRHMTGATAPRKGTVRTSRPRGPVPLAARASRRPRTGRARQAAALRGCDSEALYYGIGRTADQWGAALRLLEADAGRPCWAAGDADDDLRQRRRRRARPRRRHPPACGSTGADGSHGRVTRLAEPRRAAGAATFTSAATSPAARHGPLRGPRGADRRRLARGAAQPADCALVAAPECLDALRRPMPPMSRARWRGDLTHDAGALQMARGAREFLVMPSLDRGGRVGSRPVPGATRSTRVPKRARDSAARPAPDSRGSAAQRAWLGYRDAFLRFAAVKYPRVSRDSLATWLTRQRTELLGRGVATALVLVRFVAINARFIGRMRDEQGRGRSGRARRERGHG